MIMLIDLTPSPPGGEGWGEVQDMAFPARLAIYSIRSGCWL